MLETANDVFLPAINLPAAKDTVRTPSLVNAAVAAGLPSIPPKDDTKFAWPGTLLNPVRVMTSRLKLPTLVGMNEILAVVEAPGDTLSRMTETPSNVWGTSKIATRVPLEVNSKILELENVAAPTLEIAAWGADGLRMLNTVNET